MVMSTPGDLVSEPRAIEASAPPKGGSIDRSLADLHRSHYRSLVRMAAVLLGDLEAAEEVTQDAFLGAHRSAGRIRDEDRLLDYLRSAVLNGVRSRRRRARIAAGWLARQGGRASEEATTMAEDRDVILRAVRRLPTRQRECLILRHYLDLSEAATATTLGISTGAVKQHLHRALASLAKLAGDES